MPFELASSYEPRGDQAQAIEKLTRSLVAGNRHQTLLGVTGSGKTFTIANVIRELDRPTLVMSHNKTLAAQLYSEFKQFFPRNAVEYFVSYFDYYQPEAYIPRTDTYIEKDSSINEEIERLRLSAVSSLLSRPRHHRRRQRVLHLRLGVAGRFPANAGDDQAGTDADARGIPCKACGHALRAQRYRLRDAENSACAATWSRCIRRRWTTRQFGWSSFGDEIDRISQFDPLTGRVTSTLSTLTIYPAKQFVTPYDKLQRAMRSIRGELDQRVAGVGTRKQTDRGAARQAAHRIRPRDDAGDGLLQRHRKLFPSPERASCRVRVRTR